MPTWTFFFAAILLALIAIAAVALWRWLMRRSEPRGFDVVPSDHDHSHATQSYADAPASDTGASSRRDSRAE